MWMPPSIKTPNRVPDRLTAGLLDTSVIIDLDQIASEELCKAECIRNPVMRPPGGWKYVTDTEIAVAEYVDWFNPRRLHGEIGHVPLAEFETTPWSKLTNQHYPETPVPVGAGLN